MKYKFLGKPDWRFPDLVTGKVYELEIYPIHQESDNQIEVCIIGTSYHCPYATAIHFYQNWKLVH